MENHRPLFYFAYHECAAWAHNEISWEPNAINWSVNVVRVTCIPFIFARYSNVLQLRTFSLEVIKLQALAHSRTLSLCDCVGTTLLPFLDFSSIKCANDFVTFTLFYSIKCLSTTSHLHRLIVGSCIATATNNQKLWHFFINGIFRALIFPTLRY